MENPSNKEYLHPDPKQRRWLIVALLLGILIAFGIILLTHFRLPAWLHSDLPESILTSRLRVLFYLIGFFLSLPSVFFIVAGIRTITIGQYPHSRRFLLKPVPMCRDSAARNKGFGMIFFGVLFLMIALLIWVYLPATIAGAFSF